MTNAVKAAITAWVQSGVALAALFIPGLTEVMQLGIIGFSTATLTLWIALTYKDSASRISDNAMAAYDAARQVLLTAHGITAPTIEAIVQGPPDDVVTAAVKSHLKAQGGGVVERSLPVVDQPRPRPRRSPPRGGA